ncbi:hypothetical protein Tsubulata_033206, partial [Turnera subulata]
HHFHHVLLLSLLSILVASHASHVIIKSSLLDPFTCSDRIQTCDSFLYHKSVGLSTEQIASFYSVNTSSLKPITRGLKQDYLVSVPCTCKDVNGTRGYFYDTVYTVQPGDTFYNTSGVVGVEKMFIAGDTITLNLLCGCIEINSEVIVTYTVQDNDTLWGIADFLSAKVSGIQTLNKVLAKNPSFIDVGWVLFVPKEKKGIQARKKDATFETDRPVVYSLEEIDKATNNFEESRKIGEGGYGSVYIGILKEREVAIKKMKSSRSKEFLAELKVLCKIHHINVVELLGYASGDSHLYLVYEYVQNGSLSDHLHDPLLKGHMPLSWAARAQIALDAARGIEYIHDHTKARYVHRDIKTGNILLDQGLRAKVADFGLARLVERSNEEDLVATRLVGTPGYMAPESVRELQMTSKTDVFAFGITTIFRDQNPETALEANIDDNLRGSYPLEEVYKMAKLARQCLSEDPVDRPEIREVVQILSQILMSSIEWEASLGGSSQIFTAVFDGR